MRKQRHGPASPKSRLEVLSLNVRNFGAKGDGVTDDTAAIQAAINAATAPRAGSSEVVFSPGIYRITDTLLIRLRQGVSLVGASHLFPRGAYGQPVSKIYWAGGANKPIVYIDSSFCCTLRDLLIDGANTASCGIKIDGRTGPSKSNRVDHVNIWQIADTGTGVHVGALNHPDIVGNSITHCWIVGGGTSIVPFTG